MIFFFSNFWDHLYYFPTLDRGGCVGMAGGNEGGDEPRNTSLYIKKIKQMKGTQKLQSFLVILGLLDEFLRLFRESV